MNVETIVVSDFQTNCHIAWGDSKEAIIIDPGDDADLIMEAISSNNLTVASILLTHGHMDHISALADIYEATKAPIGIHSLDLKWAFSNQNSILPFFSTPKKPAEVSRVLEDGQKLTDGGMKYKVILTPGHTPGGVCFYFPEEKTVFVGDTLFAGSVGRTDLPEGSSRTLAESLKKLSVLPEDTVVYPGHGPSTTIGTENETNYFMIEASGR